MALLILQLIGFLSVLVSISNAQFQPSAIPLLIRSPYFSSWVAPNAPASWPNFWSGNRTLGWGGFVRVDGSVYEWMGVAFNDGGLRFNLTDGQVKAAAKVESINITPTRTVYTVTAGPMRLNFTFLSPIEPSDLALQSFPFGYVYVDATSNDGSTHSVQVYSDLSGEWISDDNADTISWDTKPSGSMVYHNAQRMPSEVAETFMAHDGVLYHATQTVSGLTWQTGGHYALRSWWLVNGSLNNTKDSKFRDISDNFPVFAFSNDLGTITTTSQPVVWAIGFVRNPVVTQTTPSGSQNLLPYWMTKYNQIEDGMQAFLSDFTNAKSRADELDAKILSAASQISPNYASLVSLAARQTFGGVEIASGPSNNALMFMRDVGSSQRVDPVETIYASFPAYLYLNATWGRHLLEPLLQYEQSSLYANPYAAPDIGANYPNAAGPSSTSLFRSIEDSSSMLIMTWAHARFSGDERLLNTYYDTLKKWADRLIQDNAVAPTGFKSADSDGAITNGTNLAIKGIIGLRAMAEISHTVGRGDDANKYQSQASDWVGQWQNLAFTSDHLMSTYSTPSSWGMIYNLFPDKWLGMNLVNQTIYDQQGRFYARLAQGGSRFGVPFDSNINVAKSHWTLLTAATISDISARDSLIKGVYDKAVDLPNYAAFPSTYNSQDGKEVSGWASPAQGAAFGILSINMQSQLAGLSGNTGGNDTKKSNAGAIAGGVIGGLAGLALIIFGFLFWRRRRYNNQARDLHEKESGLGMLFGRGRGSTRAPSQDPLADYQAEPMPILSPGNQSQFSQSTQYQDYPRPGTHYTSSSSSGDVARGQALQLSPLRLHNGDTADYYSPAGEEQRPQAPPLPRKGDLAPLRRANPSVEEIQTRARLGPPTAPSEGTSTDTSALRSEVEHLRREMEEMRTRTMYEPPPSYA